MCFPPLGLLPAFGAGGSVSIIVRLTSIAVLSADRLPLLHFWHYLIWERSREDCFVAWSRAHGC